MLTVFICRRCYLHFYPRFVCFCYILLKLFYSSSINCLLLHLLKLSMIYVKKYGWLRKADEVINTVTKILYDGKTIILYCSYQMAPAHITGTETKLAESPYIPWWYIIRFDKTEYRDEVAAEIYSSNFVALIYLLSFIITAGSSDIISIYSSVWNRPPILALSLL